MRLRDAFLVFVAAVSVFAATIVVGGLSAGNRDWELLAPLLALSLAASAVTILATLYRTVTAAPTPQRASGQPQPAEVQPAAAATSTPDQPAPEQPAPAPEQPAPAPEQPAPAPEQPAAAPEQPAAAEGEPTAPSPTDEGSAPPPPVAHTRTDLEGRLPGWAGPALAVLGVAIVIAAPLIARAVVVDAGGRPTDVNLALLTAVAWVVLVVGLAALYLVTPTIEDSNREDATAIKRTRTLAEAAAAVAVASAAMVAYLQVRDGIGAAMLPGVVTAVVGIAAGAATLIALRRRRSRTASLDKRATATTQQSAGNALPPPPPAPQEPCGGTPLLSAPRSSTGNGTREERMRWLSSRWIAGAIAVAALIPAFLAVTTLSIYFIVVVLEDKSDVVDGLVNFMARLLGSIGSPDDAVVRVAVVVLGPPLGLGAWLLTGLLAGRIAAVDRANVEMYQQLRMRVPAIKTVLCLPPLADIAERGTGGASASKEAASARTEALAQLDVAVRSMNGDDGVDSSLDWVTGSGYVSLWRRIHRAEEAAMVFAPLSQVRDAAANDEARLDGSTMTQAKALTERLTAAKLTIERIMGVAPPLQQGQTEPPAPTDAQELGARLDLRDIRSQINSFKDDTSEELVKVRRRLVQSTVWTGVVAYLLLLLVIVVGMPAELIAAASGLYLIAALAGLLQRVNNEIDINAGVEDYGVTTARLFLAPLVSGLAGVAGVALIAILGAPSGLLPQNAAGTASLTDAFNLTKYPFALILAAAFGLAPSALFNRLQSISNQLKGDVSSTDAAKSAQSGAGAK